MPIQRVQKLLEEHVPGVPKDVVVGALKSAAYSFTVTVIVMQSGIVAGIQSASFAVMVTAVYALVTAAIDKIVSSSTLGPHLHLKLAFAAFSTTQSVGSYAGVGTKLMPSAVFTFIWNALTYPSNETPVFAIVLGKIERVLPNLTTVPAV